MMAIDSSRDGRVRRCCRSGIAPGHQSLFSPLRGSTLNLDPVEMHWKTDRNVRRNVQSARQSNLTLGHTEDRWSILFLSSTVTLWSDPDNSFQNWEKATQSLVYAPSHR